MLVLDTFFSHIHFTIHSVIFNLGIYVHIFASLILMLTCILYYTCVRRHFHLFISDITDERLVRSPFPVRQCSGHHRPSRGPFITTSWLPCAEADTGGKGLIVPMCWQEAWQVKQRVVVMLCVCVCIRGTGRAHGRSWTCVRQSTADVSHQQLILLSG